MKRNTSPKHLETDVTTQELAIEAFNSSNFLTINKSLIKAFGPNSAIYISNLIDKFKYFRNQNMLREDGSFFLTFKQQTEQTGLSEHQLRRCKKHYTELGVLHTKMIGTPAKEFYFIHLDKLVNSVLRSSPLKIGGQDLKNFKEYNNTKYNNNKEKKSEKSPLPTEHKKQYISLSKKLQRIVSSHKKINMNSNTNRWWKGFQKLIEDQLNYKETSFQDRVNRVKAVLDFYEKNIGGQYIPVVESASSFYKKFTKLEDAMKREQESSNQKKEEEYDIFNDPEFTLMSERIM